MHLYRSRYWSGYTTACGVSVETHTKAGTLRKNLADDPVTQTVEDVTCPDCLRIISNQQRAMKCIDEDGVAVTCTCGYIGTLTEFTTAPISGSLPDGLVRCPQCMRVQAFGRHYKEQGVM